MTTTYKVMIINRILLPKELTDIIKDYTFQKIQKIPKNDKRYDILLKIPSKDYSPEDDVTYVYMRINDEKDYFLTYNNFAIQLQTLMYDDNTVYGLEGHSFLIE